MAGFFIANALDIIYKPFSIIYLVLSSILLSGCIPILIGAGVVTGYLATKDTVSGNIDTSLNRLWETSLRVLSDKAEITEQNKDSGVIKARQGPNDIAVKIKELTESTYNLKVTARKATALANLTLAQELFMKIIRNIDKIQ